MATTDYVTIYDLFGDRETMTRAELIAVGDELDLIALNVNLLIEHGLKSDFILHEVETDKFEINHLPY